ncbi:MAG TPA: mechanosensitive ion channel family protein [Geminicoccaceae bacterium]|jgi:small-conductance mechanosensitive channel|nr:mechanosensitive ion channel family protein [Geminicoccaceae bacterium]
MRIGSGAWLLGAVLLLLSSAHPAFGQAPAPAVVEAPAAEHGGGGFALVLLRYRLALENLGTALRERSAELMEGSHLFPGEMMGAWLRVTEGASPLALIVGLLAILGAAFMARHVVRRRLAGNFLGGASERADGLGRRLGRALYRALVDLLGLGAFALVTIGLIALFVPAAGAARTFVFTYVTAALATLAAALVSRFLLGPDAPAARLLPLADPAARFLHRWFVTLAAAGSFGWLTAALLILSGMQLEAHLLLALAVGTLVTLLLVAMIVGGRPLVTAALLGDDPTVATPLRGRVARSWHVFAIVYVVVIWGLWAASIVTRGPSSIWSAVASVLLAVALPLIDHAFGRGLDQVLGADDAATSRQRTVAIIRRAFRVVLAGVVLVLLPSFWGIDVLRLIGAPGAGVFSHAVFNILVTTLLAYVAWQLAETALERSLGGGAGANARARTLRPLLRKFMLGVLVVIWVMIALSAVGIDIGPLLAGAGVVGIALGFGAQTLVRDVVSGIFFLFDDAFRVGEYVEAGALKGTVEAISIRSLRLRHHRGAVHTVPYGELKSLTNHSRDWVIVKLEFLVTYDTDVEVVRKLIKSIGQEMLEDPELGPNLIETLKSQGINQLADHGLLVRAKFTAKPGEQFVIKREALQRIKRAFDAAGIKFAYPTVTIHSTAGGAAPPAEAVQAAARMALRTPAAGATPALDGAAAS